MFETFFELEQRLLGENAGLFDENALANLRKYKYSSVDLSPTTKYILNPFWTYCAELMPPWLAPNCITLIGISAIVFGLFLLLVFIPDFVSAAPAVVYLYFAFALIFYQTMDNIDGKQARKTGTSSPLGELFDHGIDSLNCCWAAMICAASMTLGSTGIGALTVISTTFAMYMSTWETYYTHTLFLGFFNGPTEGVLVVAASYLVTAFKGTGIWNTELTLLGITMNIKIWWSILVVMSVTLFHAPSCLANVKRAVDANPVVTYREALMNLVPYLSLLFAVFVWLSSPASIILKENHLFMFGIAFSFSFARITTCIIISHLCCQPFPQRALLPQFVYGGCILYGILGRIGIHIGHELLFLRLWTAFGFVYFFFYAKLIIDKFCNYLDINAFTIPS